MASETITYDGNEYTAVKEGMATILLPPQAQGKDGKPAIDQVFYNAIQQFNRDLSVIAIKAFWEGKHSQGKGPASTNNKNKKRKRDEMDATSDEANKALKATSESAPQTVQSHRDTAGIETEADAIKGATPAPEARPEEETTKELAGEQVQSATTKPTSEGDLGPPQKQNNFTILDALSASGLRALRYAHELPFVTAVTANDLTQSAVKSIKLNVQHNKLEDKITVSHDDAIAHMYRRIAETLSSKDKFKNSSKSNKYDVIDLDPYGTAGPFLDAAVQSVKDGGLLCVTCTDSAVWAGHSYAEKSYAMYGGIPVKGFYSHEVGLRLILHAIATSAARYALNIEPLLSLSVDYYVRIFVRVRRSQADLKFLASKTMTLYHCGYGCGAWEPQYLMRTKQAPSKKSGNVQHKYVMAQGPTCEQSCPHCKSKMHVAGPMYAGYLHSPSFIRSILKTLPSLDRGIYGTIPRIEGILQTALEELPAETVPREDASAPARTRIREPAVADVDPWPLYFSNAQLAGVFQTNTPPESLMRGALKHLGYEVTRSHCRPGSLKTNAPWDTIMFIMREWIRQRAPVRKEKVKPNSPTWRLLGLDNDPDLKEQKEQNTGADVKVVSRQGFESHDASATSPPSSGMPSRSDEEELRKTLVFNEALERLGRDQRRKGILRYQHNPENWGPLSKARGS